MSQEPGWLQALCHAHMASACGSSPWQAAHQLPQNNASLQHWEHLEQLKLCILHKASHSICTAVVLHTARGFASKCKHNEVPACSRGAKPCFKALLLRRDRMKGKSRHNQSAALLLGTWDRFGCTQAQCIRFHFTAPPLLLCMMQICLLQTSWL